MGAPLAKECEALCTAVFGAFTTLYWSWDDRFCGVLAQFSMLHQAEIMGLLEQHFEHKWDQANLAAGPLALKEFCSGIGGIQSNQLVFSQSSKSGGYLFAAWWPWGDGSTVSLRIVASAAFTEVDIRPFFAL